MGFDLSEKPAYWQILLTPGPVVTILGLIILAVAVFSFSSAAGDASGVDAILESQQNSGAKLKSMVWLVVGTLVSIAGVLWSLITFSRSSGSK